MIEVFQLFLIGAAASFGPCLLHCSATVLPYIAASTNGWKQSLITMGIFLSARMAIYTLLGLAAGAAGRIVSITLHEHRNIVTTAGGVLVIGFALLLILGYNPGHRLCRKARAVQGKNRVLIVISLAAVMGPCASLAGVLAYIALASDSAITGALFGFAFGLGKAFSPLLPLAAAAGAVSGKISQNPAVGKGFSLACGILMALLGIHLLSYSW